MSRDVESDVCDGDHRADVAEYDLYWTLFASKLDSEPYGLEESAGELRDLLPLQCPRFLRLVLRPARLPFLQPDLWRLPPPRKFAMIASFFASPGGWRGE